MFSQTSQFSPGRSIVSTGLSGDGKPETLQFKGRLMSAVKELMVGLMVLLRPTKNPCGV